MRLRYCLVVASLSLSIMLCPTELGFVLDFLCILGFGLLDC